MVKRKATTSTSTKPRRIVLAQLNTSTPADAQTTADVQPVEAVSKQSWPMPPSPPRPHPDYVPVKRIQLSRNVTLILDVKKEVDPSKKVVYTPTPYIPVFRSRFHLPEALELSYSSNLKLEPVFSWKAAYPVSRSVAPDSDDEVETVSDVESESVYGVNVQEMKKSESVEQAVDEVKTNTDEEKTNTDEEKTNTDEEKTNADEEKTNADEEKTNTDEEKTHTDDKQQNEAAETKVVDVEVNEAAEAGQLTEEPSAEEARESGEQSAETASVSLTGSA